MDGERIKGVCMACSDEVIQLRSNMYGCGGSRKCQIRDARGLLGSLSGVNRTPGGPVGLISTSCTLLDPSNRSWFELFSQICQIPPIIGCIQYKNMKTPITTHFFFVFSRFSSQNPPKTPGNPFLGWHRVWVTTEMAHRRKNNKNYIKTLHRALVRGYLVS